MSMYKDSEAFLIVGVQMDANGEMTGVKTAAVMAGSVETALDLFQEAFPGINVLSYPSLQEMKIGVAQLERAKNGQALDESLPGKLDVILRDKAAPKKDKVEF